MICSYYDNNKTTVEPCRDEQSKFSKTKCKRAFEKINFEKDFLV